MFVNAFASVLGLLSLLNANFTKYDTIYIFNEPNPDYSYADMNLDFEDRINTTSYWTFTDRTYILRNSDNPNRLARYFITNNISTYGYVDFYLSAPEDTSLRIKPHVELHLNETVNLRLQMTWISHYDQFPSTKWTYGHVFDLSNVDNQNYSWTWDNYAQTFTAQYDHTCDISFTLVPMDYSEWNSNQGIYSAGYDTGYDTGYAEGIDRGFQNGYSSGYDDASNLPDEASAIFAGIIDIGLLPINVFLQMLNLEVFGVNIAGFVTGLLAVGIIIILIKTFFGARDASGGGKK